jgi:hypothetical protein
MTNGSSNRALLYSTAAAMLVCLVAACSGVSKPDRAIEKTNCHAAAQLLVAPGGTQGILIRALARAKNSGNRTLDNDVHHLGTVLRDSSSSQQSRAFERVAAICRSLNLWNVSR